MHFFGTWRFRGSTFYACVVVAEPLERSIYTFYFYVYKVLAFCLFFRCALFYFSLCALHPWGDIFYTFFQSHSLQVNSFDASGE